MLRDMARALSAQCHLVLNRPNIFNDLRFSLIVEQVPDLLHIGPSSSGKHFFFEQVGDLLHVSD
jgi:hypothetical protein